MSITHPLIGHTEIRQILSRLAASDAPSRTFLFYGPQGVGKNFVAEEFASQLLLKNATPDTAIKLEKGFHPDLHHIHTEGKGNIHSMSTLKKFIEEQHLPPFEAKAKVYIIHDADKMLPVHANALLKTLEEPTFSTYIILIANDIDVILPTIRSRALDVFFPPLSSEEIVENLLLQGISKESAQRLAMLSDGSLGVASKMLGPQSEALCEKITNLIKQAYLHNWAYVYTEIDSLDAQDSDPKTILFLVAMWFRDLHLIKNQASTTTLFFSTLQTDLVQCTFLPLLKLEDIDNALEIAYVGVERHTKVSRCVEYLMHKLIP